MTDTWIQSGPVFEITDYTTASDWERFVANLEEILIDWKLHNGSSQAKSQELHPGAISNGILHEEREIIKYGKLSFEIKYLHLEFSGEKETHQQTMSSQEEDDVLDFHEASDGKDSHKLSSDLAKGSSNDNGDEYDEYEMPEDLPECLMDLVSTNNDFSPKAHCLVRWYNLRRYILLIIKGDTLISEDRLRILLSSASMALSNIDCHVPLFVQHHNPKSNFYQGISEHKNIRTTYEMVYFKRPLKQYEYLSELIGVFREKASCNLSDPLSVSIRLNYSLNNFDLFKSKTKYAEDFVGSDADELVKMTSDKKGLKSQQSQRSRIMDLRSDSSFEEVVETINHGIPKPYNILKFLHVGALWPTVSDKVIVDSQVHSDLDPCEAPVWMMRCVTSDRSNMKIVHDTQAIYDLLCDAIDYAYDEFDAVSVFDDCDRESLKSQCLRLSFDLAKDPEVVLSEKPGDNLRKLIVLLFHQASMMSKAKDDDAFNEMAHQLNKPPLEKIYRSFGHDHKPSVKEFIIRTQISRPFKPISTPALPQRMFCTITQTDFRLCGAFSELCD